MGSPRIKLCDHHTIAVRTFGHCIAPSTMEPRGDPTHWVRASEGMILPRYFFDVKNGHRRVDSAGVECPGDDEAKRQGAAVAHQIAMGTPSSEARCVAVINDEGREIAVR
jgi:hypothetical protein